MSVRVLKYFDENNFLSLKIVAKKERKKKLLFFLWFLWINLSNHAKKNALNQADNIAIFWSCLLPKMRLSVALEGRYISYMYLN